MSPLRQTPFFLQNFASEQRHTNGLITNGKHTLSYTVSTVFFASKQYERCRDIYRLFYRYLVKATRFQLSFQYCWKFQLQAFPFPITSIFYFLTHTYILRLYILRLFIICKQSIITITVFRIVLRGHFYNSIVVFK